jgi:hypothetical protein
MLHPGAALRSEVPGVVTLKVGATQQVCGVSCMCHVTA